MANETLVTPAPARPVGTAVEFLLAGFLDAEVAALAALDPALGEPARIARDCALGGGKRLRPTFAHWAWRGLVGPEPPAEPVLPAFAALELMHAFALVHDDVMDGSATRHGRPTAHRIFAAAHAAAGRAGSPARFGDSAAVLVGDLLLIWADRLLATAKLPAATLLAARRQYDQMRVEAVAGQYLDLLGEGEPGRWSVERALRVARLKTASYTVTRPMLFGAALAGLGAGAVPAYRAYGVAVGEAFQLRDDLLGAFGDPALTGKPAGDDLRTGKPTALLMLARELATPAQAAELDRLLPADPPARPAGQPAPGRPATGSHRDPRRRAGRALNAPPAPVIPPARQGPAEGAARAPPRRPGRPAGGPDRGHRRPRAAGDDDRGAGRRGRGRAGGGADRRGGARGADRAGRRRDRAAGMMFSTSEEARCER